MVAACPVQTGDVAVNADDGAAFTITDVLVKAELQPLLVTPSEID